MQTSTNGPLGATTPVDRVRAPRARPYYERLNLGVGHDDLFRCDDCRRLVTYATLRRNAGMTPCCGTRKVREVRHLRLLEWIKIRIGWIDFPHRHAFLAEFGRVQALDPVERQGGGHV